jgi:hypothetical protein
MRASGRIDRKATYLNKFSDDEFTSMKFRLSNLGFDDEHETIHIPELTEEMAHTYFTLSGKKAQIAHLITIINNYYEGNCDDDDFLHRSADFPQMDKVTAALLLNGQLATTQLTNLDTTGPTAFRSYMVAPDNASTVAERARNANTRDVEELMGKDAQNLSKMSTNVFANTSFFTMELFTAFLAYRSLIAEATCVQVDDSWDSPQAPLTQRNPRTMARILTNHQVRRYFKTLPHNMKVKGAVLESPNPRQL